MNASMKSLLAFAILLTISFGARAEYDVDAYCKVVKNGRKLGSTENCQTYYTCTNGIAIKNECPLSQAFDKNSGYCLPQSDVKCYFGVDKPCVGIVDGFAPIVNTCNGYIYCKNNAEVGRGKCGGNLIFHQGNCIYGDCNTNINTGTTNEGLTSVCQIMPANQFFGTTKDCDTWHKCLTNGTLTSGTCESNTQKLVFDVNAGVSGGCVYQSGNICSRVTGEDIIPDAGLKSCTTNNDKQADPLKCSAYQVCTDLKWKRVSCPAGQFYDVISGACKDRQSATPYTGCDRCQFSKQQFVNAVDPKCNKYLTCSNGVKISTAANCPPDEYFDEQAQACVKDSNGLKEYVKTNGACLPCSDICNAKSSDDCKKPNDCNCGLDAVASKCQACANGIDTKTGKCLVCTDVCIALGTDKCIPTNGCSCGLDSTKASCQECAIGIDDTTKQCKTSTESQPPSSQTDDEICEAMTVGLCAPVESTNCIVNETADKCVTYSAYCESLTTCTPKGEATCGLVGNACTLCTEGLDQNDSNKCAQ